MKSYLHIILAIALLQVLVSSVADAQVTFGTGKINVRVDAYGAVRIFTTEGVDTVQHINRISLIAAGNTGQVIDYWSDLDVQIPTASVASPVLSDYEISGTYNNSYSGLSPNYLIEQHLYGWSNQSFCLAKCIITNQETSEMPLLAGLDIVQYVDFTWENDHIFYDAVNQLLTQFDIHYVAVKILSEPTTSGQVFKWFDGYELLDTLYYNRMYAGTFNTNTLITDADGGVGILGGTPTTFQPAATKTVYFAVSVGANETEMLANMQLALQKYSTITSVEGAYKLPTNYVLDQNYPNPFNPTTKISYQLPQSGYVNLKVFNTLGKEVASLVNEEKSAGNYEVDFNAQGLSSGIYFYTIQSGSFQETKKMILLK